MAVLRTTNQVELYRARASLGDISELSGRGGAVYKTEFVARHTLQLIDIPDGAQVLDVGCGDGTLLIEAATSATGVEFTGILPTAEEVARVQERIAEWQSPDGLRINILEGKVDNLGIAPGSINILICNGVLYVACATLDEVAAAIAEFGRAVKEFGVLYIGGMPDRSNSQNVDYGTTWHSYLLATFRHHGRKDFLREAKKMIRGWLGNNPYLYCTQRHAACTPDEFETIANQHGITVVQCERSQTINRRGEVIESDDRWDYLCKKTISGS